MKRQRRGQVSSVHERSACKATSGRRRNRRRRGFRQPLLHQSSVGFLPAHVKWHGLVRNIEAMAASCRYRGTPKIVSAGFRRWRRPVTPPNRHRAAGPLQASLSAVAGVEPHCDGARAGISQRPLRQALSRRRASSAHSRDMPAHGGSSLKPAAGRAD